MEVSYPFGYGLSYTSFEWGNPTVKSKRNETIVTVDVKNTGDRAGKEVVELYVSAPAGSLDKPVKELKAFAKTRELKPGESQTITLKVNNSDLASFDQAGNAWVADAGEYSFLLGASSRDIRATLKSELKGSVEKVNPLLFNK